ncbi:MAG: peptidase M28, partial [Gemmatimonadota bacterium]
MRTLRRPLCLAAIAVLCAPDNTTGQIVQESVDLDVIRAIREEGLEHSQIEELAGYLTDVIGPRLTGSPGMRKANDWT